MLKKPDKQQTSQPVILSSHCFRRTINPPMNIHSILYAIFYVNLDLTQFSFKNVISSVCSCTLRISFIFIYTQHIFDIIRHLPRHLKLLRNTGMPRQKPNPHKPQSSAPKPEADKSTSPHPRSQTPGSSTHDTHPAA